ncbi:FA5 factor, partial [Amia calva]|nr:FA5 factor [Amia calva]
MSASDSDVTCISDLPAPCGLTEGLPSPSRSVILVPESEEIIMDTMPLVTLVPATQLSPVKEMAEVSSHLPGDCWTVPETSNAESDSDSGSSLFQTQCQVELVSRVRRRCPRQEPAWWEESDSQGVDRTAQRAARARRRRPADSKQRKIEKRKRLTWKGIAFPFLKEFYTRKTLPMSKVLIYEQAALGGFLKCAMKMKFNRCLEGSLHFLQKALLNRKYSSRFSQKGFMDAKGEISPIPEEGDASEENNQDSEDIHIVNQNRFILNKAKSQKQVQKSAEQTPGVEADHSLTRPKARTRKRGSTRTNSHEERATRKSIRLRTRAAQNAERSTASQEAERTTASPEAERSTVSPEAERSTASPEAERSTASPEAERSTASPEAERSTASPEAERSTASPEAERSTASPEAERSTASPEAERSTASPNSHELHMTRKSIRLSTRAAQNVPAPVYCESPIESSTDDEIQTTKSAPKLRKSRKKIKNNSKTCSETEYERQSVRLTPPRDEEGENSIGVVRCSDEEPTLTVEAEGSEAGGETIPDAAEEPISDVTKGSSGKRKKKNRNGVHPSVDSGNQAVQKSLNTDATPLETGVEVDSVGDNIAVQGTPASPLFNAGDHGDLRSELAKRKRKEGWRDAALEAGDHGMKRKKKREKEGGESTGEKEAFPEPVNEEMQHTGEREDVGSAGQQESITEVRDITRNKARHSARVSNPDSRRESGNKDVPVPGTDEHALMGSRGLEEPNLEKIPGETACDEMTKKKKKKKKRKRSEEQDENELLSQTPVREHCRSATGDGDFENGSFSHIVDISVQGSDGVLHDSSGAACISGDEINGETMQESVTELLIDEGGVKKKKKKKIRKQREEQEELLSKLSVHEHCRSAAEDGDLKNGSCSHNADISMQGSDDVLHDSSGAACMQESVTEILNHEEGDQKKKKKKKKKRKRSEEQEENELLSQPSVHEHCRSAVGDGDLENGCCSNGETMQESVTEILNHEEGVQKKKKKKNRKRSEEQEENELLSQPSVHEHCRSAVGDGDLENGCCSNGETMQESVTEILNHEEGVQKKKKKKNRKRSEEQEENELLSQPSVHEHCRSAVGDGDLENGCCSNGETMQESVTEILNHEEGVQKKKKKKNRKRSEEQEENELLSQPSVHEHCRSAVGDGDLENGCCSNGETMQESVTEILNHEEGVKKKKKKKKKKREECVGEEGTWELFKEGGVLENSESTDYQQSMPENLGSDRDWVKAAVENDVCEEDVSMSEQRARDGPLLYSDEVALVKKRKKSKKRKEKAAEGKQETELLSGLSDNGVQQRLTEMGAFAHWPGSVPEPDWAAVNNEDAGGRYDTGNAEVSPEMGEQGQVLHSSDMAEVRRKKKKKKKGRRREEEDQPDHEGMVHELCDLDLDVADRDGNACAPEAEGQISWVDVTDNKKESKRRKKRSKVGAEELSSEARQDLLEGSVNSNETGNGETSVKVHMEAQMNETEETNVPGLDFQSSFGRDKSKRKHGKKRKKEPEPTSPEANNDNPPGHAKGLSMDPSCTTDACNEVQGVKDGEGPSFKEESMSKSKRKAKKRKEKKALTQSDLLFLYHSFS